MGLLQPSERHGTRSQGTHEDLPPTLQKEAGDKKEGEEKNTETIKKTQQINKQKHTIQRHDCV